VRGGPSRDRIRAQLSPSVAPVELSDVTVLELVIVPNISRGAARASLKSLRLS